MGELLININYATDASTWKQVVVKISLFQQYIQEQSITKAVCSLMARATSFAVYGLQHMMPLQRLHKQTRLFWATLKNSIHSRKLSQIIKFQII